MPDPASSDDAGSPDERRSDERGAERARAGREQSKREREQGRPNREQHDGTGGLSFRLPPFRLPAFFPPTFQLRLPVPGLRPEHRVDARTILVACLCFDLVDAVLAVTVGTPVVGVVRATGGLVLSTVFAGALGLVYGLELLAVLLGVPVLTVAPSLTVLLLVHARQQEKRG